MFVEEVRHFLSFRSRSDLTLASFDRYATEKKENDELLLQTFDRYATEKRGVHTLSVLTDHRHICLNCSKQLAAVCYR